VTLCEGWLTEQSIQNANPSQDRGQRDAAQAMATRGQRGWLAEITPLHDMGTAGCVMM
jgi:hypothetical protein